MAMKKIKKDKGESDKELNTKKQKNKRQISAKKVTISKKQVKKGKTEKEIIKETKPVDTMEQSKMEATKFYPPQMDKKNGEKIIKYEEKKAVIDESQIQTKYGDNKIVLLVRDPYWCYAYWDLSEELINNKRKEIKPEWGNYDLILRIYDVTDIIFNGNNAHKFNDIKITGDANNWYINVWEAGRSYITDIGFKTADGHFILLARSNAVTTPRDKVSNITDEEWMVVDEDFDELFRLSGGGKFGSSEGFRSFLEMNLSSESVSSFSSPSPKPEENKGFFLVVDTELIVYGATEKNAKLKVKGEPIKINPDGSFSLRYHLPNTNLIIPVEAESNDGKDKISIKITVERKTE